LRDTITYARNPANEQKTTPPPPPPPTTTNVVEKPYLPSHPLQ